ncbi:branched-chain amino acid ABC transporter permease [Chamaesiphon sp. VAR_48_metabat_403]|uniref:branched-chain amino acid ABC transporter permease n=1 Tax=Chamaesiphon sp. VAR_48_metabat_403 TaxID=2964700 RepID=UPI00286D8A02|nr:branched-chain amino acid ABC transporter permease [Chamaesiphon sp. VAR_48_metabat_403]
MVIYFVFLTISAATYALFSLGLNLQWGVTGLINFGHVAFMAIGAYSTVLLSMQGVPIPIAVLVGAGLSALLGLLIGMSTLRLREDYLGIVTIGVSELVRLVAKNEDWLTKGTFGVQGYPVPFRFKPEYPVRLLLIGWLTVICGLAVWRLWLWIRVENSRLISGAIAIIFVWTVYACGAISLYTYDARAGLMLLSLTVLTVVYIGLERLVHSPWGRILKAIREDEEVPKALGKNVFWYKLQAFTIGGAIAGIAGAFYAWQFSVFPDNFEPLITFNAWIIIMLGGSGNNLGAIIGAVIFWGYYEVTRTEFFKTIFRALHLDDTQQGAFRIMIIGLILMLLMVLRPQGILGKKEELTLGR